MNTPLDSAWLRRIASLAVIPWVLGLALSASDPRWGYVAAVFGVLLCLYFAHLLLLRLQCALLDLLVASILLASVLGLTLSTPGVLNAPLLLALLPPLLTAWILYATIRAVVSAELLKIDGAPRRAGWVVLHAALLLAPTLILSGMTVHLAGYVSMLGGSDFTPYGLPLVALGILGVGGDFIIRRRTRHAAKIMLASAQYASGIHAAATAPLPLKNTL